MLDKQHVMGAAAEASEPALVLTDQAPSGLDATRFDQAQGLIERLRSWPATDQGDALSAGFVGELMAQAADALSSRSDVLRKGAERIIFENCSHTVEGDRYFAISEAMVENAAKEIAALEASSRQEERLREAYRDGLARAAKMVRRWIDHEGDLAINVDTDPTTLADKPTLIYVAEALEQRVGKSLARAALEPPHAKDAADV